MIFEAKFRIACSGRNRYRRFKNDWTRDSLRFMNMVASGPERNSCAFFGQEGTGRFPP